MGTMELTNKVKEYKELKSYLEEVQAELDAIGDEIKREMDRRETEEIKTELFTVRYKAVKSSRFDSKRFKADDPEMYSQYMKETVSRRFTVA